MDCNAKCWTEKPSKQNSSCKFHQFFCTVSPAWNGPICGFQDDRNGWCMCVCVRVCMQHLCSFSVLYSCTEGRTPPQIPLLFSNIYLTFCLSSNLLRWLYDLLETTNFLPIILFSEKRKRENSNILRKCFLLFLYVYVLCTAANCITEMKIKGCFLTLCLSYSSHDVLEMIWKQAESVFS